MRFGYALTLSSSCRDAQTATLKHSRTLKSAMFDVPPLSSFIKLTHQNSGNVDVDHSQKNIVIDNITTGFDVYPIHRSTPIHSFEVPTARKFVKMAVFGEKGSIVVGGSDHGKVYIFDLKAPQITQTVIHGNPTSLIQAVAVRREKPLLLLIGIKSSIQTTSLEDRHLIISGSSDDNSSICVWEKLVCKLCHSLL
jgi:hypothetical protein